MGAEAGGKRGKRKKKGPMNRTSMLYWFDRVAAAGLPVPSTTIVPIAPETMKAFWARVDGAEITDESVWAPFEAAARAQGFPCFLRTDLSSAKHDGPTAYRCTVGGLALGRDLDFGVHERSF